MNKIMNRITELLNRHFENVPDMLRRKKLLIWGLFITGTVFLLFGMGRLKLDMTVEGWFEKDDPILVALNGYRTEFGSDDNLFITYRPKDGNVFSAKSLEAIKGLRDDLLNYRSGLQDGEESALKHIVKVTTLVNAPVLDVEEDVLISKYLVGGTIPTSQQELDAIRLTAESQRKFDLLYYSRDMKYGGIFVETNFGSIPVESEQISGKDSKFGYDELEIEDMTQVDNHKTDNKIVQFKSTDISDYVSLMNAVQTILDKPEYADHLEYYPVGETSIMPYHLKLIEELGFIYMIALMIMIVLLWFFFGSLSAVVWPVIIIILSTIWTFGLSGWLGITISPLVMLTVMLILTIGIAETIHIMSGFLYFCNKGYDKKTALRMTYRDSGLACFLTTVTTIMGILALNVTPMVTIRVFGLMSAMGVGMAFCFALYLLPLLLDIWSPKNLEKVGSNRLSNLMRRCIPDFPKVLLSYNRNLLPALEKSPYKYIVISMAIFGTCIYGATKLKVDSNPIGQFPKESKVVENINVVDQNMMGAQNLEIYLDLKKENAFQDPFVMNVVDELQHKMEKQYSHLVKRTTSLVDIVKDSYQKLNQGREEMYSIPKDQRLLSQTLFLYNNANVDDRRRLVSDDYSKSHISIQLKNTGSYEYTDIFDRMRKDIDESLGKLKQKYPDTTVSITGMLPLMMTGVDYIVWGEIQSFALALVIICTFLLVIFGSFKAGLIALIPNLIPCTLTFGLLGLLGIPLDFNTMMLAPIIIGIAVDDTIHCVTHYRNEVLKDGDIKRALQNMIQETGQAITFATLVLGLGFAVMAFSDYSGTRNTGIFGSLAIFSGLLSEMFLLPSIILVTKFKFQNQKAKDVETGLEVINIH
jgi:uncharacterized protein